MPQKMAKQLLSANGSNANRPHFVVVPMMAQGHMIPAVDMACLLAGRGMLVSFITTPVNAARIRPTIDHAQAEGLPIRLVELKFPCAEAGLPEGCENADLLPPQLGMLKTFFNAISLLREPLTLYLRDVMPSPSCIVTDYCNFFTADVARELNLPRIVFHGPSCFFILCVHNIDKHNIYNGVDEFEPVVVPNLPRKIEVTRAQAPGWFSLPGWEDVRERAREAEASADGIVVSTFYELEPEIIECYKKAIGKPVWPVGPVCLYNRDFTSKAARGKKSAIDGHQVLSWLDTKEARSVIYVNFGSLVRAKASQLIEIGCGLEASGRPFIWVIKEAEKCTEIDKWMSEGFEERTKERGLVITGWAPQVVILSHPSVGGFVTHCGWNSMLESVCAGVPMVTWPCFADQFLNEKLVVEILRIGVPIGVKVPFHYVKEDEVAVKGEEVERAIARLIDEGEGGERRRERAAEFAKKAQKAMEEGGSSYANLTNLIEHFMPGPDK